MANNLHEGHRQRIIKEYLSVGWNEHTPEHKILETLLFYCVPRVDTNPLAHELLNRFGNIANILDAPVEELCKFKGLSCHGAALLKMIIPVSKIYLKEKQEQAPDFADYDDIGDFLLERMSGLTEEKSAVLLLAPSGKFIDFKILSSGDVGSVGVSIRDLLKVCLDCHAEIIVLCHNHPGGVALPSGMDVAFTEHLIRALDNTGIRLIDHIIIADCDYISMSQSKEYSHLFT